MLIRCVLIPCRMTPISLLGGRLGVWLRRYVDMRMPLRLPGGAPARIHRDRSWVSGSSVWYVKERGDDRTNRTEGHL